jgi:LEA14-like dessication related protein
MSWLLHRVGNWWTALGFILAIACCGCASPRPAETLDVSITDLRLTTATVFETTALFTVRVYNQTPTPLQLHGGFYKFYLDRTFVGTGLTGEQLEIAPFTSAPQTITVYLRNLAIIQRLKSILESQKLEYRVDTVLYTGPPERPSKIPLKREGTLNADEFRTAPEATAPSMPSNF